MKPWYTDCKTLDLPAGGLTCRLCSRCLTLFSLFITRFGDGNGYSTLQLIHSRFDALSAACPCCLKSRLYLDNARKHVAFPSELVDTPISEWTWTWSLRSGNLPGYPKVKLPYESASIRFTAEHDDGYGWAINGLSFEPENTNETGSDTSGDMITPLEIHLVEDKLEATSLNDQRGAKQALMLPDIPRFTSWHLKCTTSHAKCRQRYETDNADWYPDRLIYLDLLKKCFRVVEKDDPADSHIFATAAASTLGKLHRVLPYVSLSHCWGPPPNASLPNGGRPVLTTSNLSEFKKGLPSQLDLTHQHAILTAGLMGFQLLWIDSLCIIQDSKDDWLKQSATMSAVYKHAAFNIAALTATADREGFFTPARDLQFEFGFSAPWALLLGREAGEVRTEQSWDGSKDMLTQECILLKDSARVVWDYDHQMMPSGTNCALYQRGWVYQERSLARRTLAFASTGVSWRCDEGSEEEGKNRSLISESSLRTYQCWAKFDAPRLDPAQYEDAIRGRAAMQWHSTVTDYTACALTKQTDKLMAISAVAQELAGKKKALGRYLAGLWEYRLIGQMAWCTVHGFETAAKEPFGSDEYMAPSWTWASIASKVQPKFPFATLEEGGRYVALSDVREASVQTVTDFEYGPVKAGYIRLWGGLHSIAAVSQEKSSNGKVQLSLQDKLTSQSIWFTSDTVEGYGLGKEHLNRLKWMPHHILFNDNMVECICLVLLQAEEQEETGYEQLRGAPVTIYRRLGIGNFGRAINMMGLDKLLNKLGSYGAKQANAGGEMAQKFHRSDHGFLEFVIV